MGPSARTRELQATPSSQSEEGGGRSPSATRYGRFVLMERIGHGGMAEVFRAVPEGLSDWRRMFAIKRLRPEKAQSPALVKMFSEEARLATMLSHPNIVETYDFSHQDGTYYLTMEHLDGKDLSAMMRMLRRRRRALPPHLAAYVAVEIARALDHMHRVRTVTGQVLGIVHRDVTPSNIMLLWTGEVKLLDFGIARATAESERRARDLENTAEMEASDDGVQGKLSYLPPEHVLAQPVDARSDLFTLCVVLWEMLTGERLFLAQADFETLRQILERPIPAPSSVRPEVPRSLDEIVAKGLRRDPNLRWSSAAELSAALSAFLGEESLRRRARHPERADEAPARWNPRAELATLLAGTFESHDTGATKAHGGSEAGVRLSASGSAMRPPVPRRTQRRRSRTVPVPVTVAPAGASSSGVRLHAAPALAPSDAQQRAQPPGERRPVK